MYFDRFDICAAHYIYWSQHHTGQWSDGYRKLSQLAHMKYRPSLSVQYGKFENDNQRAIYFALKVKYRRMKHAASKT